MRWQGGRRSENVEDRRGMAGGRQMMTMGGGCLTLLVVLGALYFGVDPRLVMQFLGGAGGGGQGQVQQGPPRELTPQEKERGEFVKVVLGSTEDIWAEVLQEQLGKRYQPPTLVMFTEATKSGCGFAGAAVGPFYCPADQKVYIDLGFFNELDQKYGAPGDFAQAYVIAHEIGHHIQNQLGISDEVHAAQQQVDKAAGNQLSVRLELQADFLAGVWAHHAAKRNIIEPGDVEEALKAASAIGDDRLQEQARGYVTPDSFTHGSSEQRVRWFRKGLASGNLEEMDTFKAGAL
jgi:predicted metalloprotease